MGIKKIELYVVECDSCGMELGKTEFWYGFETEDEATDYACGCAYQVKDGVVYCEDCAKEDW